MVSIHINFEKGRLLKNDLLVSDEELREFEEEVLLKKIRNATEEEINNASRELSTELLKWLRHKDAWKNWKRWAESL
jgi:predicted PolB exonuclease-like 3'-5' exonuclease